MSIFQLRDFRPNQKLIYFISKLYGLNLSSAKSLCKSFGVDIAVKCSELTFFDYQKMDKLISIKKKYTINEELQKKVRDKISKKIVIKNYQGIRHIFKLSVNGQNTRTNCKTQKWKRWKK